MRAIAGNGVTHHYIYDASGDRVIKSTGDGQAIYVNGFPMGGSGTVGNYTMYVNPFTVVQNAKYTKHFYIEGQRIVSKLGEMGTEQDLLQPKFHAGDSLKNPVNWNNKKELTKDIIIANFEALGPSGAVFTAGKSGKLPYGQIKKYYRNTDAVITGSSNNTSSTSKKTEDLQFYYHPDHLGSSNYITDASGEVYQYEEYFPFGETFVEERTDAEYTSYLFNGKELDEETGLYYYGARYYDSKTSIWQSVDPLAEEYPSWSPYNYTLNNPLKLTDPDGKKPYEFSSPRPRPTLTSMWSNYEKDGQKIIEKVGGKLSQFKNQNTCAIRLSYALNKSNAPVADADELPNDIHVVSTKNNGNFVYRANEMGRYMEDQYGGADFDEKVTPENYKKVFEKMKKFQGIVVFEPSSPKDWGASGHADLVGNDDGDYAMKGNGDNVLNYLKTLGDDKKAGRVRIWSLKGSVPKEPSFWDKIKDLFN